MPADWRIKVVSTIRRVASSRVYKRCGNNLVPPVLDRNITNTYNVHFCRDIVGMCSWSKIGAGGKDKEEHSAQVGTRGGDRARFTAQLSIAKDGTKMQSCTMLKDAAFDGTREHRENLVS